MGLLALVYIPLVLLSKLVRWTIMKPQLVDMSIGWGMVQQMNNGNFAPFAAGGGATPNSIAIYDIFNVCGLSTYVEWEWFITIGFNLVIFALVSSFYRSNKSVGLYETLFLYLNIAILNIFCFNMAKEPAQFLCFILMALAITLPKGYKPKLITLACVLIWTTIYMRTYYGLILIYLFIVEFVVNNWLLKVDISDKKGRMKLVYTIIGVIAFFALCQFVLLSVLSVVSPETYAEMIWANNRADTPAASQITPIFESENRVLFTIDYFFKIFRLMLPIELLIKGKVTYLFIILYHYLLCIFLLRNFLEHGKSSATKRLAFYLYIAFWLCSAAFEPDFGSWSRHEGVAFPIIILMLYSNPQKNIDEEKDKSTLLC